MNKLLSVKEVAEILGISRVAVFNKIKNGEIPAQKVGKAYVIEKDALTIVKDREVSGWQKDVIERAVNKTVLDYGEALKLLKDA
jgi:excisionase family DNA binding protein